jgi:hypothetical protein
LWPVRLLGGLHAGAEALLRLGARRLLQREEGGVILQIRPTRRRVSCLSKECRQVEDLRSP